MKTARHRSSFGSGKSSNSSASSNARRRRRRQGIPKLTPTSSESSVSTSSKSSPDESIFKGAEILRSELLSPQKQDLWSVREFDHASFDDDDDWSNPWSVADNIHTPSPKSYRASPKSSGSKSAKSTGSFSSSSYRGSHRRCSSDSFSTPAKDINPWSPESSRKNVSLDHGLPSLADDITDWSTEFDHDASLFSGLDSSVTPSVSSMDSPPPPPPPPPRHPSDEETSTAEFGSLLTPVSDGTPTTTMGRESSLRFKTVTYFVENTIEQYEEDDSYYSNPTREYSDSTRDYQEEETYDYEDDEDDSGYNVPSKYQQPRRSQTSSSVSTRSASPPSSTIDASQFWNHYNRLKKDDAYQHAVSAGTLWQTMVGQHVKFPKTWWNGARCPLMGLETPEKITWRFIARHKVYHNRTFQSYVRHRSSSGRLLLHLVVRDLMTFKPLQDVVIGCLHPNARGIRTTDKAVPEDEACREIYMAIRKRPAALAEDASPSLIDPLLTRGRSLDEVAHDSPLGGNTRKVNNHNMKAVFGEKPPLHTVFVDESELYERLMAAEEQDSFAAPALVLLQEFT